MLIRSITVAFLLTLLPLATGCGGSDGDPDVASKQPEPADMVGQLSVAARQGDLDAIAALLSEEALAQDGATWIKFLGRTASDDLKEGFGKMPLEVRNAMKRMSGQEFLKAFHDTAPGAFSLMFNFYQISDQSSYEEGGQVLVKMSNDRNDELFLGMVRQDDNSLKLMSEAQLIEAHKRLKDKLQARMDLGESTP